MDENMDASNGKVAILGAGGLTGQFLVAALNEHGIAPRAVVRRTDYAGKLPRGTDVAVADLDDVDGLAAAIRGCASVYLIPPSFNPGEERFAQNVMAAMARAGVARVVYHSVLHSPTPGMPHHERKSRVELSIRESELAWTILQPAMYVQTVLSFLSEDRTALRPPFNPDRPFNVIAPSDLVGAIARVLRDPATAYGTFEVAGSERLSIREMAAQLGAVLAQSIGIEMADMEKQVAARAAKRGWSGPQQGEYRAMLSYYDRFGLPGNGLTLEMLLGRPPTSFAEAARLLLRA
nr:NmrA family NAD(P)-binding protein [Mesorhizobium sp.]